MHKLSLVLTSVIVSILAIESIVPLSDIAQAQESESDWYNPPTFQTAMRCDTIQGIDREWRFGYEGEKLPYRSALGFDEKYDNHIAIEKTGLYAIIATFDDSTIEKVITVIGSYSGMSVSNSQLPEGTVLEVNITDSYDNSDYSNARDVHDCTSAKAVIESGSMARSCQNCGSLPS